MLSFLLLETIKIVRLVLVVCLILYWYHGHRLREEVIRDLLGFFIVFYYLILGFADLPPEIFNFIFLLRTALLLGLLW
jgi:hypothetical protein